MIKEEILMEISKFKYFYDARVILLTNGWNNETFLEEIYDETVGKNKYKVIDTTEENLIILAIRHPYLKDKSQRIIYKKED